jgi:hypothetical protein
LVQIEGHESAVLPAFSLAMFVDAVGQRIGLQNLHPEKISPPGQLLRLLPLGTHHPASSITGEAKEVEPNQRNTT